MTVDGGRSGRKFEVEGELIGEIGSENQRGKDRSKVRGKRVVGW
jgi:hypothetical protein